MDLSWQESTDLGVNAQRLHELAQSHTDGVFVDLGVREGASSSILCDQSVALNNMVYGVDVDLSLLNFASIQGQNYKTILGDSSTVGRDWRRGKIDILFVDTLHVKEQVLTELYFWIKHIKPDGWIVFHDTYWPEGKTETFGNRSWNRVEDAVKEFFAVDDLGRFEDDRINLISYPDSWGMTFVQIKNHKGLRSNIQNWEEVINVRNELNGLFWNEGNKGLLQIDLNMTPQWPSGG